MKVSIEPRIKPAVVTLSNIKKLCNILNRMAEEEYKKATYEKKYPQFYNRKCPQFTLRNRDGRTYEFNDVEAFIEHLSSNLSNVELINLSFWSEGIEFIFRYNRTLSFSDIDLRIKANDKSLLLNYEDDIIGIFSEKSWNWIPNNGAIAFVFSYILTFCFLTILAKFLPQTINFIKNIPSILLGLAPAIIFVPNLFVAPKIYPSLVIINEGKLSGRVFKYDLWKLIVGIITIVIIPIFIGILTR